MVARTTVCLLLSLAGTASAAAEPYVFRGLALGASIADVRRARYPEAPTARIVCLHDVEARDIRPAVDHIGDATELRAGVSSCGLFTFGRVHGNTLPPEWIASTVKIHGADARLTFWVVPDKPSGNLEGSGRLYRIAMRTSNTNWSTVRAAFVKQYGKPTTAEKGTFASGRNNTLESETVTWREGEGMIRLVQRAMTPNRMMIVYQHMGLTPRAPDSHQSDGTSIPGGIPRTRGARPQ